VTRFLTYRVEYITVYRKKASSAFFAVLINILYSAECFPELHDIYEGMTVIVIGDIAQCEETFSEVQHRDGQKEARTSKPTEQKCYILFLF
jgi:hypothetical protein